MKIMRSEWKSWKLSIWWMSLITLIEIALFTTVAALIIHSRRNDGLRTISSVPIKSSSSFSFSTLSGSQVRFAALPAVFMALFGIAYASIVSNYAGRQPYVELNQAKSRAKSAKLTILLDYPRYSVFYSWAVALKNGHYLLGWSMLLVLFSSIVLVPLTAAFFTAVSAKSSSAISIQPLATFAPLIGEDLNILRDPSAHTNAYYAFEAPLLPWMTAKQAFERFQPIDTDSPADITTNAVTYAAKVECLFIPHSEINISLETRYEGEDYVTNFTETYINFVDRGCKMRVLGAPSTNDTGPYVYISTWADTCSQSEEDPYRIGLLARNNTSLDMANLTDSMVVSCIPSYWKALVPSSLSIREGRAWPVARIISNMPAIEEHQLPAVDFKVFQKTFQMNTLAASHSIVDPIVDAIVSKASLADDGELAQIGSDSYKVAMEEVFSTLFASTAAMMMLPPTEGQALRTAILSTSVFRLYPNDLVAYVLMALIFLMTLCTMAIFRSVCTTRSILTEEPVGLLGRARVLLNSDVGKFVAEFYDQHHQKTSIAKYVNKYYTVDRSKCYFDHDGWGSGGIRLEDLDWRWHVKSRDNVSSEETIPLDNST